MARLDDEQIARHLDSGAWRREGDAIVLDRRFSDFAAALAYVNRVALAPPLPTLEPSRDLPVAQQCHIVPPMIVPQPRLLSCGS